MNNLTKEKMYMTNYNLDDDQREVLLETQKSRENKILKMIKHASDKLEIDKKPTDISISTMTVVCKLQTKFICDNIAKYIDLSHDGVLAVKNGKTGDPKTNRTLINKMILAGKKKKKKSVFYNQVSMYIAVKNKDKKKPVNLKIFSNGSIQMTGCKNIENSIDALMKILPLLKKTKAIVDFKKNKIISKKFATNLDILDITNIYDFNVAMINSNFNIGFKIDRAKLYNLLISQNYECFFDPVKHACVNIKYTTKIKQISIFVFEKGAIIITGVKDCSQILDAYNFINRYLLINHKKIIKNDNLSNSNIIKYMNEKTTVNTIDDM